MSLEFATDTPKDDRWLWARAAGYAGIGAAVVVASIRQTRRGV